ncbi:MAG TPA: hypothetical protein VFT90_10215, partial [Chryseosolibacter sp.]|nr:hypothetical protein [Chryseosolibacter sp.]
MNAVFANDYLAAMRKAIEAVYRASDISELQQAVKALERIAAAEQSKWEPHYYVAFGYIMMTNHEQDGARKDAYLDQAMTAIERAKLIAPVESEVIALEGFIFMARLNVHPESRGPELLPKAIQAFDKATVLNADNPRPILLMARMQFGSARFFGTSTAEACTLLHKSLEKFETYSSANP